MLGSSRAAGALLLSAVFISLSAQAALGPFEHGSGIKAMGAGGVSYVGVDETTALSANPALAAEMGSRWDLGVDVLHLKPYARIEGNALAADQMSRSNGRSWYSIPQAGWVRPLSDRWSLGVTMLQAGLGPDYPDSEYQRFGGDRRAALTLGSASLATALAWRPVERQAFGAGLIVGYEFLRVQGLQFLASKDPQFQVSTDPDHVTNQGKDGGFSVGYTLGWTGELLPTLSAGAGYRSKSWTQKIDDYRGLLPDHGSLDLPAVYGLALAWQAQPTLNLAVEWQHYAYTAEKAFGNTISRLSRGNLLGSPDGPGFGVDNQDAYKLGLNWKARSNLVLRAGYLHAT